MAASPVSRGRVKVASRARAAGPGPAARAAEMGAPDGGGDDFGRAGGGTDFGGGRGRFVSGGGRLAPLTDADRRALREQGQLSSQRLQQLREQLANGALAEADVDRAARAFGAAAPAAAPTRCRRNIPAWPRCSTSWSWPR